MNGLGPWPLVAILGYLAVLLGVGVVARRARRDESMSDFYLAGRDLGPFVLFATLYATQYSGNSFLGYPGEAHRIGFAWVMSVGFMTAIIVAYLLIAPDLHRAARRWSLVTPGDWIDRRYDYRPLTLAANGVFVLAIANYLLAQLMAMGHVVAGLSGNAVPYWVGVVGLTAVILVYETLGGMRAVAWTDTAQGLLMLAGLGGILFTVVPTPAHLADVTRWVIAHAPEKAAVPGWQTSITWLSTLLLIGMSGAVYPQAMQRIYAARSTAVLKRGLTVMVVMPLFTMTPIFLIGILSLRDLDGVSGLAADQVMPMMLARWAGQSTWLALSAMAVMLAAVAAIMSTADSVLLTLSSIVAKDVAGRTWLRGAPEATLTRVGKRVSWAIVVTLVTLALVPRISLWGLTELKMELLVQVSPLFVLGLASARVTGRAALAGLVAGLVVAFALPLAGVSRPFGVHDGTIGWAINVLVCVAASPRTAAAPAAHLAPDRPQPAS
ncbi:MAG: sodium:solute symporter family protein [Vicinamibacterales bacterium]